MKLIRKVEWREDKKRYEVKWILDLGQEENRRRLNIQRQGASEGGDKNAQNSAPKREAWRI